MKILVCISNVPDTTTKIKFTGNSLDAAGIQWIINPWDELALTRALELKESSNGLIDTVAVIHVGKQESEPTIRKALAIGADSAIRINADSPDAYFVAYQIAAAIENDPYDLILCGVESSDYNGFAVGGMLSEFLKYPSTSAVSGINLEGDKLIIDREVDGAKEILEANIPLLAVIQKGITKEPRIPSMRGIMSARTKPLVVMEPAGCQPMTEFVGYELPQAKSACKMIDPENVRELVDLLKNEAKIL
jgi:electron transfer flavoprotein beta subunit